VNCLTIAPDTASDIDLRAFLSAPAMNPTQALYTSSPLPQTRRIMVKDEDVCLHCGLCAERCPTAAWDMRQFELLVPYAAGRAASRMASVAPSYAMPATGQAVQNV
jgi:NAD-dependent dihydropyrimidine dehydrogenase PreA subunit